MIPVPVEVVKNSRPVTDKVNKFRFFEKNDQALAKEDWNYPEYGQHVQNEKGKKLWNFDSAFNFWGH